MVDQPGSEAPAFKQQQQQAWMSGNYSVLAHQTVLMSEMLCETIELHAGEHVLDIATGSGVTAIAAARRRTTVTGLDFSSVLVERARLTAQVEGLAVKFIDGDAEEMPFETGAFDVVLSTLGIQFVGTQQRAAQEALRVCRSGGRIGLTSWTPGGFFGRLIRMINDAVPEPLSKSPTETRSPLLWADEEHLNALFAPDAHVTHSTKRTLNLRYRSIEEWLEIHHRFYGPLIHAMDSISNAEREQLDARLTDLLNEFNQSGDSTLLIPSEYMETILIRS